MNVPQEKNKIFLNPLSNDEIRRFQEIERQHASLGKARYGLIPTKNVFALRETDVLQPSSEIDTVKIERTKDSWRVYQSNDERTVVFDPKLEDLGEAILDQLSSAKSLAEVEAIFANRWEPKAIRNVCEQPLGICIEVPDIIAALDREMPLHGLLRFPVHSPYKVPRTYWENSIAVRRALPMFYDACASKESFLDALSGLHRVATVGESGTNVYGGAGGLPTAPGRYRQVQIETRVAQWCLKTLESWLRMLKVPVNLVKGGTIKSIGKRPMVDIGMDGIHCMHLFDGNGTSVLKLLDEARGNLQGAIRSAKKGSTDVMLGQLARFMQLFATAHPFNNINVSIAMNIVNDILEKQALGRLPHLYLDYVAQRTRPSDFSLFFVSVFEKHRIADSNNQTNKDGEINMKRLLEMATLYWDAEIAALR